MSDLVEKTMQSSSLDPLMQRARHRVLKLNKNWLVIISGPTGSGKSWSALSIAEQLDPEFSVDNIVFSPKHFIEFLKSDRIHPGIAMVWDETGVGLGARDAMGKINKLIGSYLQSFRSRNTILIFTLPTLSMLDKQARQLSHAILETKAIDKTTDECIIKWFDVQTNALSGKTYLKYPRIYRNGIVSIKRVRIKSPSVKLRNAYEKKKAEFLATLIDDIDRKMTPKQIKEKAKEDMDAYINSLVERVTSDKMGLYRNKKNKNFSWNSIRWELHIPESTARRVAKKANDLEGLSVCP